MSFDITTTREPRTDEEARAWASFCAQYAQDPLGWVLAVYPWGKKGTTLEHWPGPDDWQALILDEIGRQLREGVLLLRFAVAAAHGVGKSALLSWIIHWFESCNPRSMCKVTAGTRDQLNTTTWRELAKWQDLALNRWQFEWTQTRYTCKWKPNTWYASAIAWSENNPDAFAGTHEDIVMMVFDEASTIAKPIWGVAEGAFTTSGIFLAFGNPTDATGQFAECFGKNKHRWTTIQVDGRDSKVVKNQDLYKQWIEDWGIDSDYVRVRVRGLFPLEGSLSFIAGGVITTAMERWKKFDIRDLPTSSPLLMGVDIARQGPDQSVIILRKGRYVYKEILRYHEPDLMVMASKVANRISVLRPDIVFIDETGGYGAGVIDRLRQLGHAVVAVQFGARADEEKQYANKRAEMWARMKEWIRQEGMLPEDNQLRTALETPGYGHERKTERLLLESKDSIRSRGGSSPDDADALAMTFAMRVPVKIDYDESSLEPDVV